MRHWQETRDWEQARREDDQASADRQTASLAGLALSLALVVVGLLLVRELHAKAVIEDCLLAGRINCSQIVDLP